MTRTPSAIERFWDRFIARLLKQGVKATAARWYVIRAEHYLKAFPDKRLADHTAEDVAGYLQSLGRQGTIAEWQFVQVIDALQNLFQTAGVASADQVDWAFWRGSARTLTPNHPTIAREAGPMTDEPVSGARFKDKRNAPSFLDQVRREHPTVLERLMAEIRRRHYSIRTEQAYEGWLCRFIAFCGHQDLTHLDPKRIVAFLEDLAVRGNVAASTQNQALNALVFFHPNGAGVTGPCGRIDHHDLYARVEPWRPGDVESFRWVVAPVLSG